NQWANVVRWELRTRLFLRTAEFLWQEGHTAHASAEEAKAETLQMLEVYRSFAEDYMAMPVITGEKTAGERFPGAEQTFSIEAMMQDRKALQAGTSHFLGQNFAKAQDIVFLNEENERDFAWTTSWGVSTRLIGGLIMTHADDDGLMLPPKLAPAHVVILPIVFKAEKPGEVFEYCEKLAEALRGVRYAGMPLSVEVDKRDIAGGEKTWSWVKKGVPIRLEVGPRDMAGDAVFMARRDKGSKEKQSVPREAFIAKVPGILDEIQASLFERALKLREDNTKMIDNKDAFYEYFTPENRDQPEIHGGFALTHGARDEAAAAQIQSELGVTPRCIPLTDIGDGEGTCPFTGEKSPGRIVWAKSY
ncbi:MAG: proline--tRNA ligase, partial [Rhodospirillales bacterium]|nr:proline--tRNA ligase [Rhodospirillales bacterium]